MRKVYLFLLCSWMAWSLNAQPAAPLQEEKIEKVLFRSDPISEASIAFSPNGRVFYFSRDKAIFNFGRANKPDIWKTQHTKDFLSDTWTNPTNLGPQVNSRESEQIVSVHQDGEVIYFSREEGQKQNLYRISRSGRHWGVAQLITLPKQDRFSHFTHFFVSADESTLLFCASLPNQAFNSDIYVSIKGPNGEWTSPVKIDLPFDLKGDERSVFLSADQQTLFFSSNGLSGIGGYDLYRCEKTGKGWNAWSMPSNLDQINTVADELNIAISLDGKQVAYISNIKNQQRKIFFTTPDALYKSMSNFELQKSLLTKGMEAQKKDSTINN